MKIKIIILLIIILLAGFAVAEIINLTDPPDIKTDITAEQKTIMREKYNAEGYKIGSCLWINECYFCDYGVGDLKLNKRMITCNFEEDRKILELNESCKTCNPIIVGNLTMQDLIDKDVTQVVQAHTKEKEVMPDNQNMKDKEKSWNDK